MFLQSDAFRSGTFFPAELGELQAIFKEICAAPWFSQSPEPRAQFAAFLLRTYTNGLTDPEKLLEFAIDVAKTRYNQPAEAQTLTKERDGLRAQNAYASEVTNRSLNSAAN